MSTIAEELTRIQGAKASLATSIAAKGVAVPAATKIDGYSALVDQISQGGPTEPPMKALCFYDYDGTRLFSYDEDEVAAMTELPALPDHTDMGLVQEGWNWSLADIKTQIQLVGACDVGCTYATSDGKTWIKIRIDDENHMSPSLYIVQLGSVKVDWGDGSEETYTETPAHTYTSLGEYTIKISWISGWPIFQNGIIYDGLDYKSISSSIYRNYVKSIYVTFPPPGLIEFQYNCFFCLSPETLIISETAYTSAASGILKSLNTKALILPLMRAAYKSYIFNMFASANGDIKIVSLPLGCNSAGVWTSYKVNMADRLVLPYDSTIYSFDGVVKPLYIYRVPTGSLSYKNLTSQKKFKVHATGASTIAASSMSGNLRMEELEFHEYDTVPTLANVNAFTDCPTGFKIIVPQSLYAEWKAATNWSTFADYIYYRDSNGDLKQ